MNEFEKTKTLPVVIDNVGVTVYIDPYSFPSVVSGTLAGAFLGYWNSKYCTDLAQQIDNIINGRGCSEKWLRSVSDIIKVAEVAVKGINDPMLTRNIFLGYVRDGLNKNF